MRQLSICLVVIVFLVSCGDTDDKLFTLLSPDETGVEFQNVIYEDEEYNILNFAYLYNGGGVSVGDFDNNGFMDIFFSGNMVENRLYLNNGNFKFTDITNTAGIGALGKWTYGSATVDINGDGLLDIYACASISDDSVQRTNMLFINKGLNEDGIPVFEDQAAEYGIDDSGHSSQASFFDYDGDGDLDLFILSNAKIAGIPNTYRRKVNDGTSTNTDVLYRNNGDGTFTNISAEAGILNEGFGLGVAITDLNKDGAQDIYVGNDYLTNDLLYMNDGSGKFTEKIDDAIKHQSRFSMGNDAADINNDGHNDIITLDMLPETNLRKKTVIVGNGYIVYLNDMRYGYTHQHVRNMLQLNNGNMTFSEIGQLAGVHQTEWSWSPLFADFDNDGYKDLAVTNGFPKDITDNDFISFRQEAGAFTTTEQLMEQIPSVKIPNYVYRNTGGLTFEDKSKEWGFDQPSFSNGAAFVDLDNDGDLDYVTNNINMPAFIYRNNAAGGEGSNHYLRIKLKGTKENPSAFGSKVEITYDNGKTQFMEQSIYRGYVSSVEDIIHFGLGQNTSVDEVRITWPNGNMTFLNDVQVDQVLTADIQNSESGRASETTQSSVTFLSEVTEENELDYVHDERDFIDYNIQRNIPHKFSQFGPSVAVGDVNGDGLEDLYIGGSKGFAGSVYLQQADGTFEGEPSKWDGNKLPEEMGTLLFDADNDGDNDLYLVSGSFEYAEGDDALQDRLLINDGQGNFTHAEDALPIVNASGSVVRAADYDADGDLDLFVGGRVVVGAYPKAARSYLLQNDGGTFSDVTNEIIPELTNAGLVTDGIWSDYNNDGNIDLVIVGEFMPITIFESDGNSFSRKNIPSLDDNVGWWNSITSGDFDKDGDIDYVAGNVGENNFFCGEKDEPIRVTANDFDNNGALDAVLSCYFKADDGTMKPFPIHSWKELSAQSPIFRDRFNTYDQYGRTTINELFTPEELEGAIILEANYMSTSYIENNGDGSFIIKRLPTETQVAPVNGIVVSDVNEDGNPDVLMVGNDYGNEVNVGQYDAFIGLTLIGDGAGNFSVSGWKKSGFFVNGDAKALVRMDVNGKETIIVSQNLGPLKSFSQSESTKKLIPVEQLDKSAILTFSDGKTQKVELSYGSGYLSQSTRKIPVTPEVTSLEITNFAGETRTVDLNSI